MGFFNRIFKITEANANAALDNIENPAVMAEQGIRDLKAQLDKSIQALAEIKAMGIRAKSEANTHRNTMQEWENKAVALIKKAEKGELAPEEADRLATQALQKKEESASNLALALKNQQTYEAQTAKMEASISTLKNNISKWENEAKTLKARQKVSQATVSVNKELANIDSSSTVGMLERMKEKVENQEALAESYSDLASENKSVDDEINSVLEKSGGSDALAALKAKLSGTDQKAIQ
jgi:phage shock protein A